MKKLMQRVRKQGDCLIWKGGKTYNGYGLLTRNYERWLVHRYVYTKTYGAIPQGLTIHHACNQTLCVNPKHLLAMSMRENNLRGTTNATAINARKTHCKNGHEFTPQNTIIHKNKNSTRRTCRTCYNRIQRTAQKRRRLERKK